jgi:3-oxoacyl-ACP reductase-like protein
MTREDLAVEGGVFPQGPHEAYSTPDGMYGEVRRGANVVKRFRGETAWSDAVRHAGDLNKAGQ